MSKHISTWTNAAYLVAAAAILVLAPGPSAWVMVGALTLLAVGSWGMHHFLDYGRLSWESVDHGGMHATYSAVAVHTLGGPWWLMLVAALGTAGVLEGWKNVDYVAPLAVYMVAIGLGVLVSDALVVGLAGFALMALGLLAHRREGDVWHGVWHCASAAGTVFLYMIGV